MTQPPTFPDQLPPGYEWFDDEPPFDPALHLQLEEPAAITSLVDLGYDRDEIGGLPTEVAVSTPFRILSDEGAAIMLAVARRLEANRSRPNGRIERMTRSGCFRSRWLRDLCISPEVTEAMGAIYGTTVAPHPMVSHLGHLNYEPTRLEDNVDKWHHDTLPLDYVMMVTDPSSVVGGEFEYFVGTKAEAAALAAEGRVPPRDRTVQPPIPGPGWAVALHGNMVVHRAAGLREPGERITMVNGYVSTDVTLSAQSRTQDLIGIDDPQHLYTDWAKFVAWRAEGRLNELVASLPYSDDRDGIIAELEHAVEDVTVAIAEMRAGARPLEHYERVDG